MSSEGDLQRAASAVDLRHCLQQSKVETAKRPVDTRLPGPRVFGWGYWRRSGPDASGCSFLVGRQWMSWRYRLKQYMRRMISIAFPQVVIWNRASLRAAVKDPASAPNVLNSDLSDDASDDSRDEEARQRDWLEPVADASWWVAMGEAQLARLKPSCEDRCVSTELRLDLSSKSPFFGSRSLSMPRRSLLSSSTVYAEAAGRDSSRGCNTHVVAHCAAAIDGHGGNDCAAWLQKSIAFYVKARLRKELGVQRCRRPRAAEIARMVVRGALADAETGYRDACRRKQFSPNAGACVALAIAFGGAVAIANVGDSRAWLVDSHGHVLELSETHRATLSREADRVKSEGAAISHDGRVANGALEPSRTLGDFDIKRKFPNVVLAQPHSVSIELASRCTKANLTLDQKDDHQPAAKPPFAALVLASDGVCDTLSPKIVGPFVAARLGSRLQIAKDLVDEAKKHGSTDDATAVVLEFHTAAGKSRH